MNRDEKYLSRRLRTTLKHIGDVIDSFGDNARLPVSFEQLPLLFVVVKNNGYSMQELATSLKRDKSGVLRGLRSLEKRELIIFKSTESDLRKKLVFATPAAFELVDTIVSNMQRLEKELLRGVSEQELVVFNKVLDTINENCNILIKGD